MAKGTKKDIDESMLKVIAGSISDFCMELGILNEEPKNTAITLLLIHLKQAKKILKGMNSDRAKKIKQELLFVRLQIQTLLEKE